MRKIIPMIFMILFLASGCISTGPTSAWRGVPAVKGVLTVAGGDYLITKTRLVEVRDESGQVYHEPRKVVTGLDGREVLRRGAATVLP